MQNPTCPTCGQPTTRDICPKTDGTDLAADTPEPNPLAKIAGSYANDPNWDKFLQDLEDSRREMDTEAENG